MLPTAPIGALIGRIGSGPWFFVGSQLNTAVYQKGRLVLLYNDDSGRFQDNSGSLNVAITVN